MKRYLTVLMLLVVMLTIVNVNVAIAGPELQRGGSIYYVAWGDTLYSIAARYGVTVEAILRQNGLTSPDLIYVGQPLVIPGQGYSGGPTDYNALGCANYHTVRVGETLSSIAWDYNMTLQALLQHNNLYNKDIVYVGQKICLPGQAGYMPQPAGYQNYHSPATSYYHTVARGETLSSIAYRYGVNQWSIVQANNLSNASYIWAGQRLIIPGYQPEPQYRSPAPTYDHPPGKIQYDVPPAAPSYVDSDDDPYDDRPPFKEPDGKGTVPPAPDYQTLPASPPLPKAEHPITVVVNGGETWADDVYPIGPDPDSITTLIVQTGEEFGKVVQIRSGDYQVKGESDRAYVGEFGPFRFVFRYIPPGDYDVWIDDPDTPSEKAKVEVGPGERVEVAFTRQVRFQGQTFASPDGWVLSAWENPSEPGLRLGGWSNILVKTPASGLWVMIESEGGGYKAKCFTGSKGPGACDFAGLSAGMYSIWIDGTDLTLETYMDGNAYATFEFSRQ